jgi:PhnB protein
MAKRSLKPGNGDQKKLDQQKFAQLNRTLDVMLTRVDGKAGKIEAGIEPLVKIAADLRNLPREEFKKRLKSELLEGRKPMATMTAPSAKVSTNAMPLLTFKHVAQALEFYAKAFGAVETFRFEDEAGRIPHAEMKIGETVFGLADEWEEGGRLSAESRGNSPVAFNIEVEDVDSFAEHAVAAGMRVALPIKDQFYGIREGTFADPFGYTWTIGTVKEDMSVDEMHRRMEGLTHGPEGGRMSGWEKAQPIRPGFRMVTPYLVGEDGPALIDFVINAFGAEEKERVETPAGGVHGEVRIGDSMLMVGGSIPGREFRREPSRHALHVYVEDSDAVYRKAVAAGAVSIDAPRDQDYGERSASVKDPAGNFWYIATHKGESYVPEGLNNVNAYMHPLRAEPLIRFLRNAFGAEEIAKYASPDGVVHHAQIRVGDSVVEMGEAHGKYEPMKSMFYLYVPDVDALYRRAITAGATSIHEPKDQPYGDRVGGVNDAFGNQWYIASHIKDVTH